MNENVDMSDGKHAARIVAFIYGVITGAVGTTAFVVYQMWQDIQSVSL